MLYREKSILRAFDLRFTLSSIMKLILIIEMNNEILIVEYDVHRI